MLTTPNFVVIGMLLGVASIKVILHKIETYDNNKRRNQYGKY